MNQSVINKFASILVKIAADVVGSLRLVAMEVIWMFILLVLIFLFGIGALIIFLIGGILLLIAYWILGSISAIGFILNLLMLIFVIITFSSVPVSIGLLWCTELEPQNNNLILNTAEWNYPIVIPLTGIVLFGFFFETVLPPWSGLSEIIIAGGITGVVLYHGSVYPVLFDNNLNIRYSLTETERRIDSILPEGNLIAKSVLTIGSIWLISLFMIYILNRINQEFASIFIDLIGSIPLFPPSNTMLVLVPILIGLFPVALYGFAELIIKLSGVQTKLFSSIRSIGNWISNLFSSIRSVGHWITNIIKKTVDIVVIAVSYVFLLRPR